MICSYFLASELICWWNRPRILRFNDISKKLNDDLCHIQIITHKLHSNITIKFGRLYINFTYIYFIYFCCILNALFSWWLQFNPIPKIFALQNFKTNLINYSNVSNNMKSFTNKKKILFYFCMENTKEKHYNLKGEKVRKIISTFPLLQSLNFFPRYFIFKRVLFLQLF